MMVLTSVVDVVAEAGHQEAEAGDGAEVAPPARGRQRAVHGLGHHEGVPPVVVHNLHSVHSEYQSWKRRSTEFLL